MISIWRTTVAKFARAAFEKERLLGKKAEEARALQPEQRSARPGADRRAEHARHLTPEEDGWVNEAIVADDPGEWAYNALQGSGPISTRRSWIAGRRSARGGAAGRAPPLQGAAGVSTPHPDEQETYAAALGQTFLSLGLDIETHGPQILQKAEELGADHPSVQGMMSPVEDIRRLATRSIWDLVGAGRNTVQKAKTDDVVEARVKEEQLRQGAAGIQQGGPRVPQTPKSALLGAVRRGASTTGAGTASAHSTGAGSSLQAQAQDHRPVPGRHGEVDIGRNRPARHSR